MAHQYVFGLVGPVCTSEARKTWNALLSEQKIDGFFDFYRAKSVGDLELRLSEMFLLHRRGYVIDASLSKETVRLMDKCGRGVAPRGVVDVVRNDGGVLVGYSMHGKSPEDILRVWLTHDASVSH